MALSVTQVAATTLDYHSKEIADAIINNNALSAWLKASNRVRVVQGGQTFHEKVIYSETTGFDWISKSDEITLSTTDSLTDAEYDIKILAGPLKILHFDKMRAQGEQQVADLVEVVVETAKSTMSNRMGAAVFNDGTNTDALHGIQLLASTTAGETVGGIDSGTYTWWDNQRDTTGTAGFNTNQAGIALFNDMLSDCAQNDHDFSDLIVTTSAIWTLYQLSTTNVTRLIDSRIGALGYKALDFMGVPVTWDSNCPAEHAYFINSKYMYLRVLDGGEFVTSDWERVQGQLSDYATMHFYGQLTTNNRSKLGVINSITG